MSKRKRAWEHHRDEQRRAWRQLTYQQRLRWLEQAKRFQSEAIGLARKRSLEPAGKPDDEPA